MLYDNYVKDKKRSLSEIIIKIVKMGLSTNSLIFILPFFLNKA